jgi:MFS family permease
VTEQSNVANAAEKAPLITRSYILLCAAMFLGYANQWIVTPTIPLYVDDMGGSAFVAGLALMAFSLPSFTARPFVGRLADRWNAGGVLAVGLVLLALGSSLFLIPLLAMVFVAGFVRGLGWAGLNTGGYTALALSAPPERRGEAAGYYTSVTASANIVFPALGLWIVAGHGGFGLVCVLSVILAVLGVPIAVKLGHGGVAKSPSPAGKGGATAGLIDRGVLLATVLSLCSTLVNPSVMAFLPLYARSLGIEHIGYFYILAGVTNIFVRPLLGKWSDAMGRGPSLAIGQCTQLIGLVLILVADALPLMLVGGVCFALGSAVIGATTTALAMDLANPDRRGQAMATYSLSYQLGVGFGAILSGALADLLGLSAMYAGSIAITLTSVMVLARTWRALPRPVQ